MKKPVDAKKIALSLTDNQREVLRYIISELDGLAQEYPRVTFTSLRKKKLIDKRNKLTTKGIWVFSELDS